MIITNGPGRTWRDPLGHSQPLSASDIHVRCVSLDLSPPELDRMFLLLSADEKARARRFYFAGDRDRFVAGRGLLRSMLGGYLDQEPSKIEFVYGEHGKPALRSTLEQKTLEFNLSHSNGLALYIFSWDRRVGVDLEYIKPLADIDDFARQFFSPEESRSINVLSGKQKDDAFFKTWTCKESFLKANGSGLTIPINQVEISLEPEGKAKLSFPGADKTRYVQWHLELFEPLPGYQAALTVEGLEGEIVFIR